MKRDENTKLKYDLDRVLSFLSESAMNRGKVLPKVSILIGILLLSVGFVICRNIGISDIENIGDIKFTDAAMAISSPQKTVITIPTGTVKANPFVPYRDLNDKAGIGGVSAYNIVEPPEFVNENSEAARVMDTVVSGILFDKFSPSAIINIEGSDYLVKKGDVVNNYKILNISQDSVTVQLGKNTYKAGIGEILTEGTINHNQVSNLKNKFGGEK